MLFRINNIVLIGHKIYFNPSLSKFSIESSQAFDVCIEFQLQKKT